MPHQKRVRVALLVCSGIVAAGFYSFAAEEKDQPAAPAASAKARRDAAKNVYEGSWQRHIHDPEHMPADVGYFRDWSVRWLQAERDLSPARADQITALEAHLKRMKSWKDLLDAAVKSGAQTAAYEVSAAEFFRLEAEDWLTTARAAPK